MSAPIAWTVILPVKPPNRGKSRLSVGDLPRDAIARALALDTVAAVRATPSVAELRIVTSDPAWAAEIVADRPHTAWIPERNGSDLDAAVRLAAVGAPSGAPVAVVLGDLPALSPAVLDDALAAAARFDRAVVADRQGTGTTMLTAAAGIQLDPAFGAGSYARHVSRGHVPLALDAESPLRLDVDVAEDLVRIPAGLLGAATRAVLGLSASV